MERGYKIYDINELNPGDHLCVIYETDEEHKALITPYLRSGLENHEKVFYIVDARTSEVVLNYLRDDGVDVDPYLESGQLAILTVSESYMKGGVFDPDGMIKMLREETEKALEEGYSALRVTGEMSWALRGLPGSERLIEYETKLNEFFPNNKALAICQYDSRVFEPEILLDILTTHPIAVIGTEIYENFYYIPTEEFLAGKAPETTLKHWKENLQLRKQMEEDLFISEKKYHDLFDHLKSGVAVYEAVNNGEDFIFKDFNPAAENIEQVKKEKIIGKLVTEVFPGVKDFGVFEVFQRVWKTGKPEYFPEHIYKDKKDHGSWRESWVYKIPSGEIVSIYNDISDQKKVELALKESEEKFREVFNNANDAIFLHKIEEGLPGKFLEVNDVACQVLGYSKEELLNMSPKDIDSPETIDRIPLFMKSILKEGKAIFEAVQVAKDGTLLNVEISTHLFKFRGEDYVLSTSRDISNRIKAEKALKESERKYRSIFENVQDIFYQTNQQGLIVEISPSISRYSGFTREELIGKPVGTVYSNPEDRKKLLQNIAEKGEIIDYEVKLKTKDNTLLYVSTNAHIWLDENNNPIGIEGSLRDITERKKMEELNLRLAAIVDSSDDAIIRKDLNGNIESWNSGAQNMYGYSEEEMLGKPISILIPPEHSDDSGWIIEKIKNGESIKRYESVRKKKNGANIDVSLTISPIRDLNGNIVGASIIARDITQSKRKDELIKSSLKEKEMLLKEIHHRVKNNLMIISSLLDLQSSYIKDKASRNIFMESQNRARSMALIHERLYQSTDLKRIDFGEYIQSLSTELFNTYAGDFGLIELKINVEDVMLDINTAIPLGLIVNELLTNSLKHAFPEGMKGEINVDFHKQDDHYQFTVKDNGVGFPFDLDFQNTDSLGLQIVNSLTQQIDGKIELNRSHGTEFKITFKELKYQERV